MNNKQYDVINTFGKDLDIEKIKSLEKNHPYISDKLILDLMYIENYSIFLDIKLILQTVMVFLKIDDSTEGFDEEDDTQ